MRFALLQVTTAAIPPGEETFFWKAVENAENFAPIMTEENQKLKQLAEGVEPLFTSR